MSKLISILSLLALIFTLSDPAWAFSNSAMPWQGPMDQVLSFIVGPWTKLISAALVVGAFIALGFSKGGGDSVKGILWVLIAVSGAAGTTSFILPWLGVGAGALF